uniref:plakophilin-1-like n=1 Tax=Myxine glutinosa TaxID=7769 RepID=UPI00359022C9
MESAVKIRTVSTNTWSRNVLSDYLPTANLPSSYLSTTNLTSSYLPTTNVTSSYLPTTNLTNSYLPTANLPSSYLPTANLPSPEDAQRVQNQIAEFLAKHGTARGTTLFLNRSRNQQKLRSRSTSDRVAHPVGDWRSSSSHFPSCVTPAACIEGMFQESTSYGRGGSRFNTYSRGESLFQFPDGGTLHGHEIQPRDKPARRVDIANDMNTTPKLLFERVIKAVNEDQAEASDSRMVTSRINVATDTVGNRHSMVSVQQIKRNEQQDYGSMKNGWGLKLKTKCIGQQNGVSVGAGVNVDENVGVVQLPQVPSVDDDCKQIEKQQQEVEVRQSIVDGSVTSTKIKVTRSDGYTFSDGSTTRKGIYGYGMTPGKESFFEDGMTLEKAVCIVASKPPGTQHVEQGALYIQQACFRNQGNKYELRSLDGIAKLVEALGVYRQPRIHRAIGGALRNAVFEDDDNKMEVKAVGGLEALSEVLTNSGDAETLCQVTGTLWNLSSLEELKPPMLDLVLQPLSKRAIIPQMESKKDMELLHNSTGCLRNLSSALPLSRRLILEDADLVDSLVSWSERDWHHDAHQDPDYSLNTLEHSVCTLRNISYEPEMSAACVPGQPRRSPSLFKNTLPKAKPMFEAQPKGVARLHHPRMVQTYIDILGSSKNPVLREAAAGALHNITSGSSEASKSLGKIFLNRDGVGILKNLLQGQDPSTTISAIHITSSLSRCPENHAILNQHLLPSLLSLLSTRRVAGTPDKTDVFLSSACSSISRVVGNNPVAARRLVDLNGIQSLHTLASQNTSSLRRSGMAAGMVLQQLWDIKGMRQLLKKRGWSRENFVAPVLQKLISGDEDLRSDHYNLETPRETWYVRT